MTKGPISRKEFLGLGALDVPVDAIKDIKVVRTVVGGRTVYPELEDLL